MTRSDENVDAGDQANAEATVNVVGGQQNIIDTAHDLVELGFVVLGFFTAVAAAYTKFSTESTNK